MKKKFIATVSVLLTAALYASAATNDVATLVERGLFEEEANHQLDAAIGDYKEAIAHFDHERQLAATAIFRLGECYRKEGRTNDANAQYERIVREFPDQTQLAQLSHAYLPASAIPSLAAGSPALPSDEADFLRKAIESIQTSPDLINNQLSMAVRNGYVSAAEFLLAHGADAKQEWILGEAAHLGNEAMVRLLLAHGADVNNGQGYDGRDTPLSLAVGKGFKNICLTLISNGADVNLRSPIVTAASMDNAAMVELLLNHGAGINQPDNGGNTALSVAVEHGFMIMCRLLVAHGADLNTKDKNGSTPLDIAIDHGNLAAAEFFVTNKVRLDATNNDGDTALLKAATLGNMDMAKMLLDHGASVNVANNNAQTPLVRAIARGQNDMVKLLLDHGADANVEAVAGDWSYRLSPLFWAIQFERPEIVKLLLEHKADPNAARSSGSLSAQAAYAATHSSPGHQSPFGSPNGFAIGDDQDKPWLVFPPVPGETPLMLAAAEPNDHRNGAGMAPMLDYQWIVAPDSGAVSFSTDTAKAHHLELAQLLLDHGAKPNLTDRDGWTALFYAIGVDNSSTVRLLIEHGASVNALDKNGRPPLAHLNPGGSGQIEDLLLKAGADVNYNRRHAIWLCDLKGTPKQEIFQCPTNSVNHYTLLDFLATLYKVNPGPRFRGTFSGQASYALLNELVPFPDFARVTIHRLDSNREQVLPVNVADILRSGNGSNDVALQPGDAVEIPEKEHKVADQWVALSQADVTALNKCLFRTVQLVAQGGTNLIALAPSLGVSVPYGFAPLGGVRSDSETNWLTESLHGRKPFALVRSFHLDPVVRNFLLNTWDLSRVRLKRDSVTMIFDLTQNPPPEVWLENGDVIEIPQLGEGAPAR